MNLAAYVKLTRIKEHLPYDIALSLLGIIHAVTLAQSTLDMRALALVVANTLAMCFAFMINDIEDAPDDARDPKRKQKNVISSGALGKTEAYMGTAATALGAFFLYHTASRDSFVIGAVTLALGFLYSSKRIRLKAYPVVDIVSHALMLSALLYLSGFAVYNSDYGTIFPVFAGLFFVSAYGQLYNQIRDFNMDKLAKLKNTAILLGRERATRLMYGMIGVAAISFIVAGTKGLFPVWLLIPVVVATPIAYFFVGSKDSRGTKVVDKTGMLQNAVLVILNIVVFVWIASLIQ